MIYLATYQREGEDLTCVTSFLWLCYLVAPPGVLPRSSSRFVTSQLHQVCYLVAPPGLLPRSSSRFVTSQLFQVCYLVAPPGLLPRSSSRFVTLLPCSSSRLSRNMSKANLTGNIYRKSKHAFSSQKLLRTIYLVSRDVLLYKCVFKLAGSGTELKKMINEKIFK